MKINHDLRHKISVVEAQGKALIGQKVELEAGAQAQAQEVCALRQEVARLRERLHGEPAAQSPEELLVPQPPSPAEVRDAQRSCSHRVPVPTEFRLLKAFKYIRDNTETFGIQIIGSWLNFMLTEEV